MPARRYIGAAPLAVAIALVTTPRIAAAQHASTIMRRVWAGNDVELSGSPSPNERLISFRDDSGELAVHDLVTGQNRRLTHSSEWDEYVGGSVFSPDGRRIAYAWYNMANDSVQLRVMALDSATPHVLYQGSARYGGLGPEDWTPDGRIVIATATGADGHEEILLVPVAGGTARVLKRFPDRRSLGVVRVSPDGKSLAYDYRPRPSEGRREFRILSIDGGRESAAVRSENGSHLIGWAPDGSRIVFGSEGDATPSVWSLRVDAGEVRGNPTLIRGDMWSTNGLRLTPRGSLFYSVIGGDRDVQVASYDPGSGQPASQPVSVTNGRSRGDYWRPSWSPDGRSILYITRSNGTIVGANTITIRSADGANPVVLQPKVAGLASALWTSDGKSLVLQARDSNGRTAVLRLDLQRDVLTWLAPGAWSVPALSKDGQWMYYVPAPEDAQRVPAGWKWRLVAHNLATGAEHDLYVAPQGTGIPAGKQIVTDGKRILFETSVCCPFTTQLQVIDLPSGRTRPVPVRDSPPRVMRFPANQTPVGFSPNGRYVLFAAFAAGDTTGNAALWRVPVEGGTPERILDRIRGVPRLSPDGRRLLWVAGDSWGEVWVMEDPAFRSQAMPGAPVRPPR